jgi:hypothetical protein
VGEGKALFPLGDFDGQTKLVSRFNACCPRDVVGGRVQCTGAWPEGLCAKVRPFSAHEGPISAGAACGDWRGAFQPRRLGEPPGPAWNASGRRALMA